MRLGEISTVVGLAGLIVSVILLAWQTRAVAQQTKISNAIAAASIVEATTSDLREVFLLLVQYPWLREHFYGRKAAPRRGRRRSRVVTIAEIYGDTLEMGLVTNRLIPMTESLEDWTNYCCQILTSSPVLYDLVREHPEWWPELARLERRTFRSASGK